MYIKFGIIISKGVMSGISGPYLYEDGSQNKKLITSQKSQSKQIHDFFLFFQFEF